MLNWPSASWRDGGKPVETGPSGLDTASKGISHFWSCTARKKRWKTENWMGKEEKQDVESGRSCSSWKEKKEEEDK